MKKYEENLCSINGRGERYTYYKMTLQSRVILEIPLNFFKFRFLEGEGHTEIMYGGIENSNR